jgi:hypothetical protein
METWWREVELTVNASAKYSETPPRFGSLLKAISNVIALLPEYYATICDDNRSQRGL